MKWKCIFLIRHTAKKVKNVHFCSFFAKARLGFHFKYIFFIHSEFQSYKKWNENEMENDGKMKWWENELKMARNGYHEQPY